MIKAKFISTLPIMPKYSRKVNKQMIPFLVLWQEDTFDIGQELRIWGNGCLVSVGCVMWSKRLLGKDITDDMYFSAFGLGGTEGRMWLESSVRQSLLIHSCVFEEVFFCYGFYELVTN